jgi:hypothetical protein
MTEPDWDTVMEMEAESRRDHFFPVADEDVTFPEAEPTAGLDDWEF